MDGSDAAWPADVEFVEYVRARQHTLLRAAFLVCGDVHLAEDLLQGALVTLARRWEQVRDEAPDAYVRRILYRDAVRRGASGGTRSSASSRPGSSRSTRGRPRTSSDASTCCAPSTH